ncbi:transposase InsO family protein [Peribacillus simplex]|nr:transposase InsO family protein [Peribacillus simplex]
MCGVLELSRSTYYYEAKERTSEDDVTNAILDIFDKNRKAYGTRKIKVELKKRGLTVSRRRIGRIMKEQGLVSSYTVAQYKPQKTACNESVQANELNREFLQEEEKKVVVSDLTYVKVKNKWHYICVFVISLIVKLLDLAQDLTRTPSLWQERLHLSKGTSVIFSSST